MDLSQCILYEYKTLSILTLRKSEGLTTFQQDWQLFWLVSPAGRQLFLTSFEHWTHDGPISSSPATTPKMSAQSLHHFSGDFSPVARYSGTAISSYAEMGASPINYTSGLVWEAYSVQNGCPECASKQDIIWCLQLEICDLKYENRPFQEELAGEYRHKTSCLPVIAWIVVLVACSDLTKC